MRSLLACLLLFAVGCTHYEFDLTQPANIATHIGTKSDSVVALDPLEYRFLAYEDHLIVRIFNPTDDPVQLVGEESAVVDPTGQSHPLRTGMIEPHSFVKLILPPPPLVVGPYGPSIGISIGGAYGYHYHRHGWYPNYGWRYYDPWYYAPRYFVLYDQGDTTYWNWRGESSVRVALAYLRNGKTFRDEFEFARVKVKN